MLAGPDPLDGGECSQERCLERLDLNPLGSKGILGPWRILTCCEICALFSILKIYKWLKSDCIVNCATIICEQQYVNVHVCVFEKTMFLHG